jgi:hypothetical protein
MPTQQSTPAWDHVQAAAAQLLDLLQRGDLPTTVARTWIHAQRHDRPAARWSFGNQILMALAGTEDARGYRQWQEVGRHVKQGAKAFYILAPLTRQMLTAVTDPETGETRQEQRTVVIGFKPVPVFRLEDTDGAPVEYPTYAPPTLPPLQAVAEAWGYTITYGPGDGQCFGWTNPAARRIHLMTHEPGTFWHELGHAADARRHTLRGGQDPAEEIVAETVAATLSILYGTEAQRLGYTRRYLEGYAAAAQQAPAAAVMGLLHRIQEALQEIWTTAASLEMAASA